MFLQHSKSFQADPQHIHGTPEGDIINIGEPHLNFVEVDAGCVGGGAELG